MAITAAQLQVLIGADTSGAERGMAAVSRSLQRFGADAMKVGGVLSAAVTAPLALLGKGAIEAATNLDREMRNIQSISKQTDAEIAALSDTFVRMSMDAGVTTDSAVKLAAAYYDIQGSGFAGAEGMRVLEAATKAASAGLTDTDVAAKAITATLNAYGYGADEATRVSDVLFKTMDIGVVSFEELAQNLGDIVGTAAIAGVSIEELGAGYATMTKAGIGAAESSTALNQLMLSFISPSKQAAEMAATLGIDLSAAALQSKGLGGAMAEVMEATGGNVEALSVLFPNVRALKAALSLTRGEMGPFKEDLEAIGEAAGATEAAFAIQAKSFAAQMKTFQNTLEGLKISVGNIVLPVLTELMNRVKPLLDRLLNLDDGTKRLIVTIGVVAAAAGPVIAAVGALSMVLGALLTPAGLVIAAVAALGAAFATDFGGIRSAVMPVLEEVGGFLQGEVLPVLQRLGEIAQRAFGGDLRGALTDLGGLAGEIGPRIAAALGALATQIGEAVARIDWADIWARAQEIGTGLLSALGDLSGRLTAWLGEQWARIDWARIWATLGDWASQLAATAGDLGGRLTTWLGEQWARIDWARIWARAQGLAAGLLEWVAGAVRELPLQAALAPLAAKFAPLLESLGRSFANLQAHLRPIGANLSELGASLGKLWEIVSPLLLPALELLGAILGGVIAVVIGNVIGLVNGFINALGPVVEMVTGVANGVVEAIGGVIQAFGGMRDIALALGLFFRGQWLEGWEMLMKGLGEVGAGILGIFQGLWDAVKSLFLGAFETISAFVSGFVSGIVGWFQSLYNMLVGHSIIPDMVNAVLGWWTTLKETGTGIWDGIVAGIKGAVNSIIGFINRLIGAWNGLEFRIPGFGVDLPKVDIPGVGTVGGGHLGWGGITVGTPDLPTIPLLGAGGVVTRPTLAVLGERGPEAVVPLSRGLAGAGVGGINVAFYYQPVVSLADERELQRAVPLLARLLERELRRG